MTVLGYVMLALGLWLMFMGGGVLASARPPEPDEVGVFPLWVQIMGGVIYFGIGLGFACIWWWLACEPIRRWWWRRTGKTGRVEVDS